ncbi:hypothetical protein ACWCP6_17970 [Streptomyces sp. NPDC002004]
MADHFPGPSAPASSPSARRLVAAGVIRRSPGRTITMNITAAGVTGSIRPAVKP